MEIIFFILVVFTSSNAPQIHSVEIHPWHIYADRAGQNVPCERAIQDPAFQKYIGRQLAAGQRATLQCRPNSEMKPMAFLLRPDATVVKPVAPAADSDARIRKPLSNETRQSSESEPGSVKTLRGNLLHRPFERGRRSVAAYLGVEFFLRDAAGKEHPLYPSVSARRDLLLSLAGQTVELDAEFVDRTPAPGTESSTNYPLGPDGGPLKRQGYSVLKVHKASGEAE